METPIWTGVSDICLISGVLENFLNLNGVDKNKANPRDQLVLRTFRASGLFKATAMTSMGVILVDCSDRFFAFTFMLRKHKVERKTWREFCM